MYLRGKDCKDLHQTVHQEIAQVCHYCNAPIGFVEYINVNIKVGFCLSIPLACFNIIEAGHGLGAHI